MNASGSSETYYPCEKTNGLANQYIYVAGPNLKHTRSNSPRPPIMVWGAPCCVPPVPKHCSAVWQQLKQLDWATVGVNPRSVSVITMNSKIQTVTNLGSTMTPRFIRPTSTTARL